MADVVERVCEEEQWRREAAGGMTVTVQDVIPSELASTLMRRLQGLPASAWQLEETRPQEQPMRFFRLRADVQTPTYSWASVGGHQRQYGQALQAQEQCSLPLPSLLAAVRRHLEASLRLAPSHERLLLNVSRYTQGCFLSAHRDEDAACRSFRRRRAVVLYLVQETYSREDGGLFVDHETGQQIVPQHNAMVHFAVPRLHEVTPVVGTAHPRFALYGWIVTPRFRVIRNICSPEHRSEAFRNEATEKEQAGDRCDQQSERHRLPSKRPKTRPTRHLTPTSQRAEEMPAVPAALATELRVYTRDDAAITGLARFAFMPLITAHEWMDTMFTRERRVIQRGPSEGEDDEDDEQGGSGYEEEKEEGEGKEGEREARHPTALPDGPTSHLRSHCGESSLMLQQRQYDRRHPSDFARFRVNTHEPEPVACMDLLGSVKEATLHRVCLGDVLSLCVEVTDADCVSLRRLQTQRARAQRHDGDDHEAFISEVTMTLAQVLQRYSPSTARSCLSLDELSRVAVSRAGHVTGSQTTAARHDTASPLRSVRVRTPAIRDAGAAFAASVEREGGERWKRFAWALLRLVTARGGDPLVDLSSEGDGLDNVQRYLLNSLVRPCKVLVDVEEASTCRSGGSGREGGEGAGREGGDNGQEEDEDVQVVLC